MSPAKFAKHMISKKGHMYLAVFELHQDKQIAAPWQATQTQTLTDIQTHPHKHTHTTINAAAA